MRKTKADLVRGWLDKARRDFQAALNEFGAAEILTDIVCFHAQQAAEKYIKAYLVWHEIDFPKTHVLEDLIAMAAQVDAEILRLQDQVVILTPYAVSIRYPEFEVPSIEDARNALTVAQAVRDYVLGRLPAEVTGG